MGEIVGLSFNLIDFYVPVLTPKFHLGEAALHLSKNVTFFANFPTETRVISKVG
jgi:hypothetical protein